MLQLNFTVGEIVVGDTVGLVLGDSVGESCSSNQTTGKNNREVAYENRSLTVVGLTVGV